MKYSDISGSRQGSVKLVSCAAVVMLLMISLTVNSVVLASTLDEAIGSLATELAEQAQKRGATNLAIVGFSELNGYESALTEFLAEELTTAFFAKGDFDIVERRELERVMNEHELYSTNLFDKDKIVDFEKLLGVNAIVTGSVTRLGDSLRLNTRVIDVETGKVFGAAASTVDSDPLVDQLLSQPKASRSRSKPIEGQVGQPSDVLFRNEIIQVTPTSVIRKNGNKMIVVTAEVRNVSDDTIYLSKNTTHRSAKAKAMTEAGTVFSVGSVNGLARARGRDSGTELHPNKTLLVRWVGKTENSIVGDTVNLRDPWVVTSRDGATTVQVEFERIRLN